jgi:short-subunit dehydrogenase
MTMGYCAVVTGASGGLGSAFARALAPHASALILAGRRQSALEALRAELTRDHPQLPLYAVAGELTQSAGRHAVRHAAAALPAPLDLLVNNAGVNDFHAFESQSDATLERLVAVNLLAPMQLAHDLLPLMRRAPRAQIVNVGSTFGYIGYPGFAAYCATKFGLRGFSEALRRELADSAIAVRYFAPRAIRTALTTPAIAALNRALGNREDEPARVARALLRFLEAGGAERRIGFPERLYVWLNRVVPALNERALKAQLGTIQRHLPPAHADGRQTAKE